MDERMADLPGQGAPGGAGPDQRPPAGSVALVLVLSVIVVLFACGGAGLALYLINGHHGGGAVAASAPGPSGGTSAKGGPASTASPLNPAAVVTGECVANDGTEDVPKLRLTACAPGSFLVVGRFDGTDDVHRCDAVAGATHNFFYRTDPASLSFVLCLKRQ